VQEVIGQSPHAFGLGRSRWWLAGISQSLPWLARYSLSGVWRLLRRLGLRYKRGRDYVHSPDPAYETKLARLHLLQRLVRQQDPDTSSPLVLVYADEFTCYRQPTLAAGYAPVGSDRPYARRSHRRNSKRRIAATLDMRTGRLFAWQRDRFDRSTFCRFCQALDAAYPHARRIWLVLDNWPVHFHPDVIAALARTKIRLVPLPTYAPWTNPVEKFWRKLKQEVLHLHPFSDDWPALQQVVQTFLDRFADGSESLLLELGLH